MSCILLFSVSIVRILGGFSLQPVCRFPWHLMGNWIGANLVGMYSCRCDAAFFVSFFIFVLLFSYQYIILLRRSQKNKKLFLLLEVHGA